MQTDMNDNKHNKTHHLPNKTNVPSRHTSAESLRGSTLSDTSSASRGFTTNTLGRNLLRPLAILGGVSARASGGAAAATAAPAAAESTLDAAGIGTGRPILAAVWAEKKAPHGLATGVEDEEDAGEGDGDGDGGGDGGGNHGGRRPPGSREEWPPPPPPWDGDGLAAGSTSNFSRPTAGGWKVEMNKGSRQRDRGMRRKARLVFPGGLRATQ